MEWIRIVRFVAVSSALMGVLLPQMAFAASPPAGANEGSFGNTTPAAAIVDVALQSGGRWLGQVLDTQGRALPGLPITLHRNGQLVTRSTTDQNGEFSIEGLRGGVYQLATANGGGGVYRVWSPGTAPPAAQDRVAVVVGSVVRGQYEYVDPVYDVGPYAQQGHHHGKAWRFLTNPWVIGAIVATAIVVPLALNDNDDAS